MDPKANYTIVGLFVILMSVGLLVLVVWLSTMGAGKRYHIYLIYMNEAVSGLSVRSPVKYNGVEVGYVNHISLNPDDPQQVRLELYIEQGTPITESVVATLRQQGVTGLTYVGLKATSANAPPLKAVPGEPYPVIKAVPSLLVQLDQALRVVTDSFQTMRTTLVEVFNKKNKEALTHSLENIEKISKTLSDNATEINASLKSAQVMLHNASQASKQLPNAMSELRLTLKSAHRMSKSLDKAGQAGQAALNAFSEQALPSAVHLINRLHRVASNLDGLTYDLKQNPAMLIRGRLPEPLGPGE